MISDVNSEMDNEQISHLHIGHYTDQGNFSLGHTEIPSVSMEDELSISSRVFQTALLVDKYYTPLLCLFGTMGNSLSLLVFWMDVKYRSQSAPFYLSALAVSDTGYLLNLFLVWLESVYSGGVITSRISCPLVMYLGQVTCFISVYLIVAFSIERYVAVHFPFSRPRLCTRNKAKKIIFSLTICALAAFSYVWVIAQVIEIHPGHHKKMNGIPNNENSTGFHHHPAEYSNFTQNEQFDEVVKLKRTTIPVKETNNPLQTPSFPSENVDGPEEESQKEKFLKQDLLPHQMMLPSWESIPPEKHSALPSSSPPPPLEENDDYDHDRHRHNVPPILRCSVPEKYYYISGIANYMDTVFTLVIPFLLITFLNMRIAICVWKLKNQREEIMVMGASNNKSGLVPEGRNIVDNYTEGMLEMDDETSSSACSNGKKRCSCISRHHHRPHQNSNSKGSRRGTQTQILFLDQQKRKENGSTKLHKRGVRFQTEEEQEEQQQSLLFPSATTPLPSPSRNYRLKLSTIREKSSGNAPNNRHHFSSSTAEVRVTNTLLLISCIFLLLNLPAHVLRCAQFIQSLTGTSRGKDFLIAALPWTNILFNTNFAVNFLLYCASGRNFRKSLLNIVLRVFGERHNNNDNSAPQRLPTSFLARMKRKRADSAGFTTATIRLSTSVPNGTTNCEGELSSPGENIPPDERDGTIQMESMPVITAPGEVPMYSTYIGDNTKSVSV